MKKANNFLCNIITTNKAAYYSYFIEKEFNAGLLLQGWEVKSLRAGQVNIRDSYIILRNSEAFLLGSKFQVLRVTSSYTICDTTRSRKLLLKKNEIYELYSKISQNGYSAIALSIFWQNAWAKLKFGIGRGKKQYDKRRSIKDQEWKLDQSRMMKNK
ncbi:SsrA-binding protein SmpB [Candidatus Erwinia haradaeae]|uniref:SsrA-binding protein n=1 Tax=Candidatus Erwinia haradaeae TaxID=1922217 RepID=A0A451D3D7_9GAMM|nr:SsrA-binding protein SmpB [Candidatus Erwinia haradaeae]VFP80163.1 SsrA-binding protein [Candidatus Erwinia haradaeae]